MINLDRYARNVLGLWYTIYKDLLTKIVNRKCINGNATQSYPLHLVPIRYLRLAPFPKSYKYFSIYLPVTIQTRKFYKPVGLTGEENITPCTPYTYNTLGYQGGMYHVHGYYTCMYLCTWVNSYTFYLPPIQHIIGI